MGVAFVRINWVFACSFVGKVMDSSMITGKEITFSILNSKFFFSPLSEALNIDFFENHCAFQK
jgi:hypothetical protein